MEERTRDLMTMDKALHIWDDVDRLYESRNEGRRLASNHDSLNALIQRLEAYIKNTAEFWLQWPGTILTTQASTEEKYNRQQAWEEKQMYGYFLRHTCKISHQKTWIWLRNRNIKKETESLLTTAQSKAIRTNYVKPNIDKMQ